MTKIEDLLREQFTDHRWLVLLTAVLVIAACTYIVRTWGDDLLDALQDQEEPVSPEKPKPKTKNLQHLSAGGTLSHHLSYLYWETLRESKRRVEEIRELKGEKRDAALKSLENYMELVLAATDTTLDYVGSNNAWALDEETTS